ncbi:MAG TPA: hypothetical protein DD618_03345 [Acholeplasmatales bacterium]|nr:hypothetical protein [Acholeplasmatales bacterium]
MNRNYLKAGTIEELLWAKSAPRKKLQAHLRETAIVARTLLCDSAFSVITPLLAGYLGLSNEGAVSLASYLAGIHDLGKCHPSFQETDGSQMTDYLKQHVHLKYPISGKYRHENSNVFLRIWESDSVFENKKVRRAFKTVIKLHHQGKQGDSFPIKKEDIERWPGAEDWLKLQDEIELEIRNWLKPPIQANNKITDLDSACVLLSGLVILSDWIASGDDFSTLNDYAENETVRNEIKLFIAKTGLEKTPALPCGSFTDLWTKLNKFSLRPLQVAVEKLFSEDTRMPLALILEAPMGEGKTEAGVYAAMKMAKYWNKEGMYVALPTSATANQMVGRINALLKEHGKSEALLVHSMSWLNADNQFLISNDEDEIDRKDAESWFRPTKRGLLAPYAVGTVDQAMMAVLKVKYGVLRLFGLSNKVLIIDEIHAYDAYMSSIIRRLLEWCRALRIPVVMLSATLPTFKKQDFMSVYGEIGQSANAYPLITAAYDNGHVEQTAVEGSYQNGVIKVQKLPIMHNPESIAMLAIDQCKYGGCICIIMNTVAEAQNVYSAINSQPHEAELILFHSQFPLGQRQKIEEQCFSKFGPDHSHRPKRSILVATQVVEQSLDLDFDAMITAIAPIDLLLQRCGRLHRHRNTKRAEVHKEAVLTVLVPGVNDDFGITAKIYYPLFLDRTKKVLDDTDLIRIPEDIPNLVEVVYQQEKISEDVLDNFLFKQFHEQLLQGESQNSEIAAPDPNDFGLQREDIFKSDDDPEISAKTRLGEINRKIAIVPMNVYKKIDRSKRPSVQLARLVMQYSLTAPSTKIPPTLKSESNNNLIEGKGLLAGIIIMPAQEFESDPTETLKAKISGYVICFDNQLGLVIRKED